MRQLIGEAEYDIKTPEYHALYNKTSGRVAMLSQLKHPEAKRYRKRLNEIQPIYTQKEITKTEKIVSALCKTPIGSRSSSSYLKRFYQARYRVNITGRTDGELAKNLHEKLSLHKPTIKSDEAIHGK